ncbi:MAG: acyl-CoA dehydrogenase [Desulfovermiculus sp.]|nr:acyl-CoA dehydrogenase [Desulfovermiculus sp.]
MAQQIVDRREIEFILHELLDVNQFSKYERFYEFNRKAVNMIVYEARQLAIKEILPTNKIGDIKGVTFHEGGVVKMPQEFHRVCRLYREGGWIGTSEAPEWGGQGMPKTVSTAVGDYLMGANCSINLFFGLTIGAGHLIEKFGTEQQKEIFLDKLYTGQWGGTMLLSEPQAGSDVGAVNTSAAPRTDGTYSISGTKIWVSGGEQDLTENIIHPVLARIEGAPPGTAGISLFIVPKYWVNADGSMGNFNNIVCTGTEKKMGIHGSATCTMSLGDKQECRGLLLGQANKGMREMFLMMNRSRLLVGMQAMSCAGVSYLNAVNYARERIQGRNLTNLQDKTAAQVPIIQHPDVRRMLLTMKAYVEGMRFLMYYVNYLEDMKDLSLNENDRDRYQGIIDLLIPICKGYCTDRSLDVCNIGIQIYGGYGYTQEYPQEQLYRDCRITPIYEGTNGIQAMDLLGRKLGMKKGQAFVDLVGEIQKTIKIAQGTARIDSLAQGLQRALHEFEDVSSYIGDKFRSESILHAYAHAYSFMEVSGDLIMGWMLLWRATKAAQKLDQANKKDKSFYEGQIKSCKFFNENILPVTLGKIQTILQLDGTAVEASDDEFGGK